MTTATETEHEEHMSPDESPSGPSSGVRRVNNLPIYIIGGAVFIFLIVMMLVAADRANQQNRPEEDEKAKAGNTNQFANKIAGSQNGGLIPEPAKPLVVPEMPTAPGVTIARANDVNAPPTPPQQMNANQQHNPANDEAQRIRQMKLQQLQEAIKAHTTVQVQAPRSAGSAPNMRASSSNAGDTVIANNPQQDIDPTNLYKARMARLRNAGLIPGAEGQGDYDDGSDPQTVKTGASGNANNIDQFSIKKGETDRWELRSKPEAPRSPYELRAGFVVPGTLISGINSELPGQIMAQVSQNVYDTATGKYLLIPQGARLVGAYSSQVAYGQARVLVAWQRIVFPDGKAMDLGAMPGADSAGYAGFNDLVDNHYARIFGSALIMSAVSAGIQYSQQGNQPVQSSGFYQPTASNTLSQALGQQLGHATAQMIQKNMNIAPTLEIRPGYRFNIIVIKDLTFSKPYQAFDY